MPKIVTKCLLLCILAIGAAGCTINDSSSQSTPASRNNEPGQGQAEVIAGSMLINSGQASSTYVFSVESGATVFDVMKKLTELDRITMQHEESSAGVFLKSLNGTENNSEEGRYWMFYVNGEMSNVGADKYSVEEGDLVEWKFINIFDIEF